MNIMLIDIFCKNLAYSNAQESHRLNRREPVGGGSS